MKKIGRRFMSKFFLYFRISEDQGVLTISNLNKKREIRRIERLKNYPSKTINTSQAEFQDICWLKPYTSILLSTLSQLTFRLLNSLLKNFLKKEIVVLCWSKKKLSKFYYFNCGVNFELAIAQVYCLNKHIHTQNKVNNTFETIKREKFEWFYKVTETTQLIWNNFSSHLYRRKTKTLFFFVQKREKKVNFYKYFSQLPSIYGWREMITQSTTATSHTTSFEKEDMALGLSQSFEESDNSQVWKCLLHSMKYFNKIKKNF